MLPWSDVASFGSGKTAVKVAKPWWDVITDYLVKFMLMIALLVGGIELTSGSFDCLPAVNCPLPKNRTFLSELNYCHNACTAFYTCLKIIDGKATTVATELTKYPTHYAKYVNSECRTTASHWFSSHLSLILFGQALILLIMDNLWLIYPPTASMIETFSELVFECHCSPGISFCLPRGLLSQTRLAVGDPNEQKSEETEEILVQQNNERPPSREDNIAYDVATAAQVRTLLDKVERFMESYESSKIIWKLYVAQVLLKVVSVWAFFVLNLSNVDNLKKTMKCSVDSVLIPVEHDHFTCIYNLAPLNKIILVVFLLLLGLYFLYFISITIWIVFQTQYNSGSDIQIASTSLGTDTRFLLRLLKVYNQSYAEEFNTYRSNDFRGRLQARIREIRQFSS